VLLSDAAAYSEVVVIREFWWCSCHGNITRDAECHGIEPRVGKYCHSLL